MVLAGCAKKVQGPQTEGIKIGELTPTGRRIQPQILRTININVVTYELPAENVRSMDDIWAMLNPGTLRYTDSNGFTANRLRAATGEFSSFGKIDGMLKAIKAKKLSTTELLIPDGQSETLDIGRLTRKTTISYIGPQAAIKNTEAGPGNLGLLISARKIINERGMVSVQVLPVISTPTEGLTPALASRLKAEDIRFYSAGFGLNMKPGSIVVLGPSQFNPDETTAAGRFFTRTGNDASVRVLLMVCTSIK
jgi:hypothetical protein